MFSSRGRRGKVLLDFCNQQSSEAGARNQSRQAQQTRRPASAQMGSGNGRVGGGVYVQPGLVSQAMCPRGQAQYVKTMYDSGPATGPGGRS